MINRDDLYLEEIEYLRQRVEHLEASNQQLIYSLDLLHNMGVFSESHLIGDDPTALLSSVRRYISRLVRFRTVAFFGVRDDDASFELAHCIPEDQSPQMEAEIEAQIDEGMFAWALNQNRAVIVNGRHYSGSIMLHAVSTRRRVRGMFIGVLDETTSELKDSTLKVLSMVISVFAHALESASVYSIMDEQKRSLEALTQKQSAQLEHHAHHDALTGLANRRLFLQRLGEILEGRDGHDKSRLAVVLLDLDKFKRINDSLGYRAGDVLLQEVAERMRTGLHMVRATGGRRRQPNEILLSRLGGDEFGLILNGVESLDQISVLAQDLVTELRRPYHCDEHEVFLSASAGIGVYPDDSREAEELVSHADAAMHVAKHKGPNLYQFYTEEMNSLAFKHLLLENQMHQALELNEFLVYYQPQVDLHSGRIVRAEALLRWQHPEMGMVMPGQFIPLAEETGLITALGQWVFKAVCDQVAKWQSKGLDIPRVAVNVSARQFRQDGLLEEFQAAIESSGVDPSTLEIELTESTIMGDIERTAHTLESLRNLGLHLAIDDFGTGYSSFAQLKHFSVDIVKIDRSFVRELPENGDHAAIVKAMIAMTRGLGLEVLAEGVETAEQHAFLQALGCRYAQGFYFHRPMPAGDLERLLQKQQAS